MATYPFVVLSQSSPRFGGSFLGCGLGTISSPQQRAPAAGNLPPHAHGAEADSAARPSEIPPARLTRHARCLALLSALLLARAIFLSTYFRCDCVFKTARDKDVSFFGNSHLPLSLYRWEYHRTAFIKVTSHAPPLRVKQPAPLPPWWGGAGRLRALTSLGFSALGLKMCRTDDPLFHSSL